MANYYTKFSVGILLLQPACEHALRVAEAATAHHWHEEPLPDDFPPALTGCLDSWNFSADVTEWTVPNGTAPGLWIHDDAGGGGVNAACEFLQWILATYAPDSDRKSTRLNSSH